MLKKANIQWTGKTLKNQMTKGQLSFECAVQRGFVWDADRKSLLIHSMIEGYPIPAFYFVRKSDGTYDGLDGQQRSTTIKLFIDNEFPLAQNTPPIIDENGYPVNIAGLKFMELPEWAQDAVKDYSLTIYYFEDITDEEISELFYRINNGKPLTSVELTRVKAKSLDAFQNIAAHRMISESISEAGKKRYNDENVAMQAWVLCYAENPDFTTKNFRPLIESADVNKEQADMLKASLDYILSVRESLNPEVKEDKRVLRKINTRSHMVSCIYLAKRAIDQGISSDAFRDIVYNFFDSTQTSRSEEYNSSVGSGSAKPDKIRTRISVLNDLIQSV